MSEITDLPLDLPSVSRKKVTAAFDGGRLSSDGGVMLLSAAERRIGIIDRLWRLIPDHRNPLLVTHSLASILMVRTFAIACGYEDGNDLAYFLARPRAGGYRRLSHSGNSPRVCLPPVSPPNLPFSRYQPV